VKFGLAFRRYKNPGNLGTILRTATRSERRVSFCWTYCTDPYGSGRRLKLLWLHFHDSPVYKARLAEFQEWALSHPDVSIVGTSDKGAEDYASVRYAAPAVLLLGSEREGCRGNLLRFAG
jgi:TrmH family RNA methyltransferase